MPFLLILLAQLAGADPATPQATPETPAVEQQQATEEQGESNARNERQPEVRCVTRAVTGQRMRQRVCRRVDDEAQQRVEDDVREIQTVRGGTSGL